MEIESFDLKDIFFPRVLAQAIDGTSQPTFGPIDVGATSETQAQVTLTAASTAAVVGDAFTVDVDIATGTGGLITVAEYRLVIDFDTTKLRVLDAEPTISGTQIEFLDTLFEVEEGTNNVTAAGRVSLTARTPSGAAYSVNRTVARITFQAQQLGTTTVTLPSGSTGNQLINQSGIALPVTLNSVTVNVGTQQLTSTSSATSSTGTGDGTDGGTGIIPDTGISDEVLANLPVLIGVLLIVLGIVLSRSKDAHE